MGPEIPTAAADQNFAWICKQHQDLIGSVLRPSLKNYFRPKFQDQNYLVRTRIWPGAMWISKRNHYSPLVLSISRHCSTKCSELIRSDQNVHGPKCPAPFIRFFSCDSHHSMVVSLEMRLRKRKSIFFYEIIGIKRIGTVACIV